MLLSKLVYLCVKNAVYYDDSAFTYEEFLKGTYNSDPDYATNIHNVLSPMNIAISRLNDLDRLPFAISELTSDGNSFSVASIKSNIKEIMGVAAIDGCGCVRPLNFIYMYGTSVIRVLSNLYPNETVNVEYKQNIPYFTSESDAYVGGAYQTGVVYFNYQFNSNGTVDDTATTDVDIMEYGINDTACNYIIEYVKGALLEPVDAHLSVMHINRAEAYFNNLPIQISAFNQRNTETVYEIGR